MKALIIYHSAYHHNTEKIAQVIAARIQADLLNLKESRDFCVDDYELIGFGSGVYKESMSPQLLNYAEKLNLVSKDVFVFSTSGVGMKFYNKKLLNLLASKGARCRGSFACKGSFVTRDFSENRIFDWISKFAEGHPNKVDFSRAEKFIDNIDFGGCK